MQRRIAFASFAGTAIEFFDFFVYGTAAALVFPTVFFPALGATAGTVAAFASFAVAFVARPVGAVVFGHLGDRLGRKRTLTYTLLLMGVSTVGVGVLPSAASIGVAAPVVLVVLRVLQGIAVGGEWGGAALLAVEHSEPGRRGRAGMYPQLGPGTAFFLTSATFLISGATMSREAFLAWGWRIPFLLSAVLIAVGLYVRLRIAETPVFRAPQAKQRLPLRTAFSAHTRQILLGGGALSAAFGLNYIGTVYLTSYGTTVLGLSQPTMLLLGVIGGIVLVAATAAGALRSDRVGRRRVVLGGNIAAVVCGLVVFPIIDTGSVVLVGVGLCLLLAIGGGVLGPAAAYMAELFETGHRYTAVGLSYNLATVLGGAVPPLVATALQASYGSFAVGALMSVYGVVSVACVLALPETRARSLERLARE
ncbi:MFS transporter [Allokutzneria sp. NRRL B-24872]|uniref:MFS transporter n=1 Tax=Allokutzneria sp. NRRL B-24872 TaxID=1137961 RepID=UPI001AEF880B|nr:MFS transporter [Allokutzneria sp. NRRL B-24872]